MKHMTDIQGADWLHYHVGRLCAEMSSGKVRRLNARQQAKARDFKNRERARTVFRILANS